MARKSRRRHDERDTGSGASSDTPAEGRPDSEPIAGLALLRPTAVAGIPLRGAACLVTGASGGIGTAVAHRLAGAGARLALHGRNVTALHRLADETAGHAVVADLTEAGAAESVVARAEVLLGPLDVVVSNAGAGWAGPFVAMDPDRIDDLVALNLGAPLHLARAALPGMVARGRGHLVLVGSIAGHVGVPREAVYSAAKSGLACLANSLRDEVSPAGVGVSLVSPGAVATAFFEHRGQPYDRVFPRPIRAERVAAAVEVAVTQARPRVIVPGWMELPAALATLAPGLYRRLSARWT